MVLGLRPWALSQTPSPSLAAQAHNSLPPKHDLHPMHPHSCISNGHDTRDTNNSERFRTYFRANTANLDATIQVTIMNILEFPLEILDGIVAHLVAAIGIRRAVLLRPVCRSFDLALLNAICVAQVVDVNHPDTPGLEDVMCPVLRSKIWARKAMSPSDSHKPHISAISRIVFELQDLAVGLDVDRTECWFEKVAAGVSKWYHKRQFPDFWKGQSRPLHLLCGSIILGIDELFTRLLEEVDDLSSIVNKEPDFFDAPLTLAVTRGNINIVRRLMLIGANLEPEYTKTPYSVYDDCPDQADFDAQDASMQDRTLTRKEHSTPLVVAVSGEHDEILKLFLQPAHRLRPTSFQYFRALVAAAEVGRVDFIDALFTTIGKGIEDVTTLSPYMLCAAVRGGHTALVQSLVDSGVDINGVGNIHEWVKGRSSGAVKQAAALGNTSMVRYLLEHGALAQFSDDLGSEPQPIEAAASQGRIEAVHLLLDYGADVQQAIYYAAQNRQLALIRSLLNRYPKLLEEEYWYWGRYALVCAINSLGSLELITFLVKSGVPLNTGYSDASSIPLNVAKADGEVPLFVMDHLISLGAEPTPEDVAPRKPVQDRFGVVASERTREWTCLY